jgi:alcohol dehydrogenase class IV
VERAGAVHHVGDGLVDELAAQLRGDVRGSLLVALGGGRVVDVAKALVAADPVQDGERRRAAAVPTTLSAAEMTSVHRHATGVAPETPRVRPAIVITDPALAASQPEDQLAASALNALGHAFEGPATTQASPIPILAGEHAARLLVRAWDGDEPDRDALALGALLSGYTIGAAWYGLHHVMSQTLVRLAGAGHGPANAILLPVTTAALRERNPSAIARLDATLGEPAEEAAARLRAHTGAERLRDLGIAEEALGEYAAAAAQRAELHLTPPAADAEELRALYAEAW